MQLGLNVFLGRFFYVIGTSFKKLKNIIFILISYTKDHRSYCIKKSDFFKSRISPSVFLEHQDILYKKYDSCNSLSEKNKMFDKNANVMINSLNKLNSCFQFNDNQLDSVPEHTYNKVIDQNHCSTKKLRSNHSFKIANYELFYKKLINKIRLRKKIHRITNKYTKNVNQNNKILNFYKNKLHKNNIILTPVGVSKKCTSTSNLLKQKKPVFYTSNISQDLNQSDIYISSKSTDKIVLDQYNSIQSIFPGIDLLKTNIKDNVIDHEKLKKVSHLIEEKLLEYRIVTNVVKIVPGPVITRFELNLSAGIKSSKITSLSRDLARALSVDSVRVIEIIPGTPYVGLEIPNTKRHAVYLRDIISSDKFQSINSPLALVLGKDVSGQPIIEDLKSMPHLLIAGTTGSGKSIGINAMIISILYKATPEDVRFIMIDPKILELSIYASIPHILKEVVTNIKDAESILQWCVEEMDRRYQLMSKLRVRNLEDYNQYLKLFISNKYKLNNSFDLSEHAIKVNYVKYPSSILKKLPYIVIIIDEFSDLMMMTTKKLEVLITRLTQKARAAGIHLILSTQRPSVDVITGLIKANIPARIAFTVSSKIDSRTILGQSGAESLLGKGDMLYLPPNSSMLLRVHGAYLQDQEIHEVVNFWKSQSNSL